MYFKALPVESYRTLILACNYRRDLTALSAWHTLALAHTHRHTRELMHVCAHTPCPRIDTRTHTHTSAPSKARTHTYSGRHLKEHTKSHRLMRVGTNRPTATHAQAYAHTHLPAHKAHMQMSTRTRCRRQSFSVRRTVSSSHIGRTAEMQMHRPICFSRVPQITAQGLTFRRRTEKRICRGSITASALRNQSSKTRSIDPAR